VVGVNEFVEEDAGPPDILRIGEEADRSQRARMAELRATRDATRVERALEALHGAAAAEQNVIPAMLDCARAYCTLYEIREVLERVYGAYREPVFF
jgi:methylmalonyl-CoA mutase N-terminal domain/subunit